jgi:hypothetical protein
MSDVIKLRDLLDVSADDVHSAFREQAKDENAVLLAQGQLTGFAAGLAADELNKALDSDVFTLLAQGWTKVQAVRDAAKGSLESGETRKVTLGQHELTSTHHPVLTIRIAQVALPELKLTLELVARFKSAELAITGGRIRSLAPGEASAIARLKYKSVKLKEQSTPAWKLPGRLELGDGVPVVGSS